MPTRFEQMAIDDAQRDVRFGIAAGLAISALWGLGFALVATSTGDAWAVTQLAIQTGVAAWFTYALYRRRPWAAIALLVLWAISYFWSWIESGRFLPPMALIGVLIWYGLYRGWRGTRALAKRFADPPPAAA